jgi:hypothetical protein
MCAEGQATNFKNVRPFEHEPGFILTLVNLQPNTSRDGLLAVSIKR